MKVGTGGSEVPEHVSDGEAFGGAGDAGEGDGGIGDDGGCQCALEEG